MNWCFPSVIVILIAVGGLNWIAIDGAKEKVEGKLFASMILIVLAIAIAGIGWTMSS